MNFPRPLVSTAWLADHIDEKDLLIFDTSIFLQHKEGGGYIPESGRAKFDEAHIPGAQFLDLISELADPNTDIPFMMPAAKRFGEILQSYGVTNDSHVVFYNNGIPMWSTRAWWMFRSVGLENVAVLDGGWQKWQTEGRPVTNEPARVSASSALSVQSNPKFWSDKQAVLANIETNAACTINALAPEVFSGEKNQYGRAGHIPGSHNIYYGDLINEKDGTFHPAPTLREKFAAVGALDDNPVIAYCGGGISATMDAMMLFQLGKTDVSVYDGSMSEWIRDPDLPLNLGTKP
ncbi:MAG: sulfurtransferase [Gammaproteobacteria bacterium]